MSNLANDDSAKSEVSADLIATQSLRVALLQLAASGDTSANLVTGVAACRAARALGADIALFPEMWSIAYTPFVQWSEPVEDVWQAPERLPATGADVALDPYAAARATWQAQAVDESGDFVGQFRALARELDLAIAISFLQRWPGAPRNAVSLINRHGEIVFTYAKVHTCDFGLLEDACTPGDGFRVGTLETAKGDVRVGAMICYDREFPESARVLMLAGAEIILVPNSCDMEANRLGQLRARAYENMVGVALANYPAPQCNGHSVAYSPIAFGENGRTLDTLVVEAGPNAGIFIADFDLTALRDWRQSETWGNAFRRPQHYRAIVDDDVEPPFVRVNARGERFDQTRRHAR